MEQPAWIDELRAEAARLLESGDVVMVIGYEEASLPDRARPVFITRPEQTAKLIFDRRCEHNLTTYLTRKELPRDGKLAVVVKGCDLRALPVLQREAQIDPERIITLGVACNGVGPDGLGTAAKCVDCQVRDAAGATHVFGEPAPQEQSGQPQELLDQLLA